MIEMTKEYLSDLEALAKSATSGPWEVGDPYDGRAWRASDLVAVYGMGMEVACTQSVSDAAFIAASREAVPHLLREVRRLRAELAYAYGVDYLKANPSYTGPCPMCKRGNE
jgi:hypothetical protein